MGARVSHSPQNNVVFERGPFVHELPSIDEDGVRMLEHAPSRVRFLAACNGFVVSGIHRYDKPGLNVSVRYVAGGSTMVSVYVFPFDPPRTSEHADEVFSVAMADMLAVGDEPKAYHEQAVAFAHATRGLVLGRRCEARGRVFRNNTRLGFGLVELFTWGAWMLKIRATSDLAASLDVEAFLSSWFMASTLGVR